MNDPKISIFESVAEQTIENISFSEIIFQIKSSDYQLTIEEIQEKKAAGQKRDADALKKSLPAFTPSGVFDLNHRGSSLKEYSGILHLDIDKQSIATLTELENELRLDKKVLAFLKPFW